MQVLTKTWSAKRYRKFRESDGTENSYQREEDGLGNGSSSETPRPEVRTSRFGLGTVF